MTFKNLYLVALTIVLPLATSAQHKAFSFNQIQTRNSLQEWGNFQYISEQIAEFSESNINVSVDKKYNLVIISKTNLPNNGIIYLCKDEKDNPITVMLIDNIKMYLYDKTKRFLINFNKVKTNSVLADSD